MQLTEMKMVGKKNYTLSTLERQLKGAEALEEALDLPVSNEIHPYLHGLDVPALPYDDIYEDRWLVIVEYLIGVRRIFASRAISEICGISQETAEKLIAELKRRWAKTLTPAQANSRRESLYQECERVKALAWEEVLMNPKEKVAYLRLVLEAQKRQATLCGLDKLEVSVEQITTEKKEIAIDASPETLSQIGLILAQSMSQRKLNDE